MVVFLVIEATNRVLRMVMYKEEIKIDAPIMLITAFISLACNIFSLIALDHLPCCKKKDGPGFMDSVTSIYKPHGGHDCSSHNHGHSHGACSHSHDHKHEEAHHHHEHSHDHEKGHDHAH